MELEQGPDSRSSGGLIEWMHQKNLKITLNLHPADGIGTHEDNFEALANDLGLPTNKTIAWNIENEKFYKAFFKNIMRPPREYRCRFLVARLAAMDDSSRNEGSGQYILVESCIL